MFTIAYLVCFAGEPCYQLFEDDFVYSTREECVEVAKFTMDAKARLTIEAGDEMPIRVDYQCVSWDEA